VAGNGVRNHSKSTHNKGEIIKMKYVRYPTNLILERPQMKHLFGKLWWDKRYKQFVKGDKKVKKTIDKSGQVCYNKLNK
jgi:hypothetical protein